MDAKQRIEQAKQNIERGNRAKTTAEAQRDMATEQVTDATAKLAELGVTPDTAAAEIASLESKIDTNLTKVEGLIPTV